MPIIKIPLKGITHATSDNNCSDGDMSELINLRHKDGSLQPTYDTKEVFNLTGTTYEKVFVHHNGTYENWLGINSNAVYWFAKDVNGKITPMPDRATALATIEGFTNVEQMGNVVILTNATGIHYFFFRDGAYTYISGIDLMPKITFSIIPKAANANPSFDLSDTRADEVNLTAATFGYDFFIRSMDVTTISSANLLQTEIYKLTKARAIDAAVNEAQDILDKDGWTWGYRYFRYAIKLYDGSYILQSAPILITPPRGSEDEFIIRWSGSQHYFLSVYKIMADCLGMANADKFAGIVTGVDIFMSQQITRADYDRDLYCYKVADGVPKRTIAGVSYAFASTALYEFYNKSRFADDVLDSSLFYKVHSLEFKDLSTSSSFVLNTKDTRSDLTTKEVLPDDDFTHNINIPEATYVYNSKLHTGNIKTKLFGGYLQQYAKGIGTFNPLTGSTPTIGWNYLSPNTGYTHQTRSGINTAIFSVGFGGLLAFKAKGCEAICFYGTSDNFLGGFGTLGGNNEISGTSPYGTTHARVSRYLGSSGVYHVADSECYFVLSSQVEYQYAITETTIRTPEGVKTVYSDPVPWGEMGNALFPLISYPDYRAEKLTIWLMDSSGTFKWYKVFNLKAHTTLNLAYYIDPLYASIPVTLATFTYGDNGSLVYDLPPEGVANLEVAVENTPGKIKVSKVSNPFYFAAENTYSSDGDIVGFATINEEVSAGTTFGQLPLYVFTTNGTEMLEVGTGSVYYTRMINASRDVCLNRKGILPLRNGVLFPSSKGLMLISGSSVKCISLEMRGVWNDTLTTESQMSATANNSKITTLLGYMTAFPFDAFFESFLLTCTIGFDYQEDEVYLSGYTPTGMPISFVYCLTTGLWHKSTLFIKQFVNVYPKLYRVLSGSSLIIHDMNQTGLPLEAMMISRPIKFGSTAFKKMSRVYLRGSVLMGEITESGIFIYTYEDEVAIDKYFRLMVFGSQDCETWKFIGGVDKQGSKHDLSTDVFPVTCKYFRIVFAGTPFYGSRFDMLEFLIEERYKDKPR